MKNKYVISSLIYLSEISIAFCNDGIKTNVQHFAQIGIGVNVIRFLESDADSLFGINGSIQGYLARSNGFCGMLDACASWIERSIFNPALPIYSGVSKGWINLRGLKGYVFDGDIAIGKDFCSFDDNTIRFHKAQEHDFYSRIGVGIDIGSRKISFKNKEYFSEGWADEAVLIKVDIHSFFIGAKCKMMYYMDNALIIFDIKAGPVVHRKGEYVGQIGSTQKMKTEQNIGAEVKAYISGIYRISDNDFGIGMKVSGDYNYKTEKVREIVSSAGPYTTTDLFTTTQGTSLKGKKLYGAFSNNIIGIIELVFVYSTV